MVLTDRQEQIVIGTVLGGSSLLVPPKGCNYYLAMRSRNNLWLEYKMAELPQIFPTPRLYKSGNTYRCYSCCHNELTKLRAKMFPSKHRQMTLDLIDRLRLRDSCLAIWFLEAGGKTGRDRKNAYLNTTTYGVKGSKVICDYFNLVGCECAVNKNKDRRRVVFSVGGTESLFKLTAHLFPTFMYHVLETDNTKR